MSPARRSLLGYAPMPDGSDNDEGWSIFSAPNLGPYRQLYFLVNITLGIIGTLLNTWAISILLHPNLRSKGKFALIISMTFFDLLTCISAIGYSSYDGDQVEVPGGEIVGTFLCQVILNRYLVYCLSAVSAWHIVVICIERYISIRFTEWYDNNFTKFYQFLLILLCVVIGSVSLSPNIFAFSYKDKDCIFEWPSDTFKKVTGIAQFVTIVVVPVAIMTTLYYKLYRRYRDYGELLSFSPIEVSCRSKHRNKSRKVFLTVILLVFFYIVTWVPSEVHWLAYTLDLGGVNENTFVQLPYLILQTLTLLNGVSNPILYACSFGQFRYRFRASATWFLAFLVALIWCDGVKIRQLYKMSDSRNIMVNCNVSERESESPLLPSGITGSKWSTTNKSYYFLETSESCMSQSHTIKGSLSL